MSFQVINLKPEESTLEKIRDGRVPKLIVETRFRGREVKKNCQKPEQNDSNFKMEDSLLSVEELSICFGDNKVVSEEKDFVKDEDEDDIQCELMRMRKNDDKPLRLKINRARSTTSRQKLMASKHSPLPSLGDRNLAENFGQNREQQDAVWSLCSALNVPSKDQSPSISGSDPQLHLCAKRNENKLGRTILAPLQDKKHHLYAKQNESFALKPQTPPRGKQKKNEKELDHEVHFTPISKSPTFGHDEDPGQKRCEKMIKPGTKFLSPTQGLKEDEAGLDYNPNRRFSMPVSPRLLRRFNKEKVYTSKVEGSERENKHNYPERSSVFSPPSKEFDSIQDQKDEEGLLVSNDFIPHSTRRENRRSLDLNLDTNSLRFLSEIKVSFGREPGTEPVFPKVNTKPEQRKKSYSLSASSETIFRESLPEVVPLLPPVQTNGRNRAATFTSLEAVVPSFESKMPGKTTLEAPMFLEVGSKRLSHLSLSPRLSRKH